MFHHSLQSVQDEADRVLPPQEEIRTSENGTDELQLSRES